MSSANSSPPVNNVGWFPGEVQRNEERPLCLYPLVRFGQDHSKPVQCPRVHFGIKLVPGIGLNRFWGFPLVHSTSATRHVLGSVTPRIPDALCLRSQDRSFLGNFIWTQWQSTAPCPTSSGRRGGSRALAAHPSHRIARRLPSFQATREHAPGPLEAPH